MKGRVYFVVNEGSVVYASNSKDAAEGMAMNAADNDLENKVKESGRDIDDLTEDELAEFGFASGYDGGYYYVDSIEVAEEYDPWETFETCEGDEISYGDIEDAYEEELEY